MSGDVGTGSFICGMTVVALMPLTALFAGTAAGNFRGNRKVPNRFAKTVRR